MAKQKLNHSRQLDNMGEERRSALEEERLRRVPTAKQQKFFRQLCAKMRENGIEPPTPNPYGRMGYTDAISEALGVLRDAGVDVVAKDAKVEHYVMPGEGRRPGDITRSWSKVEGGKHQRPPKVYNRNGLVPRSAKALEDKSHE